MSSRDDATSISPVGSEGSSTGCTGAARALRSAGASAGTAGAAALGAPEPGEPEATSSTLEATAADADGVVTLVPEAMGSRANGTGTDVSDEAGTATGVSGARSAFFGSCAGDGAAGDG
ncbi:hypothetical protein [Archangium sp.]|uniref:hypothetical protein n=1 Tax=Archangium sp. TaxID=1872627 RepID=UPI002D439D18|nr:hypothetical protein [Archangium sp.]HYO52637.1 hypothetical protein [Archangium sp.]